MSELLTAEGLSALLQVIMIDLVLAGDNAIVIGLAAAGLPNDQRNKAILVGIIAATVLRIVFAALTTQLLEIIGLLLAGGILLLWVCWKMWRELRAGHAELDLEAEEALEGRDLDQDGLIAEHAPNKTFRRRRGKSSSPTFDVARQRAGGGGRRAGAPGGARLRPGAVDRADGIRRRFIARLLQSHRWIAYVGLAVIVYVAFEMIYRGALEVWPMVGSG